MLKKLWSRIANINIPLVAAALFASAILHIVATFATPHLTPRSAYSRLSQALPVNKMQVLPEIAPGAQPLPYMTPDARYAACYFNAKRGTVTLSAVLPEPGWALQLYSPAGEAFFTSVGVPTRRTEVTLLIVPGDDAWRLGAQPTGLAAGDPAASTPLAVATPQDAALTLPATEGIAVLRAPDQGEAYRNRALAEPGRAKCTYRKGRQF